jgi:Skp family chaperone for outer membrane proteins
MLMRKLKTVAGLVLAATMTCVGVGILCRGGLIMLAAAAGRPLQAADAGAMPSAGEPLFAVANDPPDDARDSPASRADPREPTDDSPRTAPPRTLAPPAEGALPLHTRIGLINMTRVLKAATAYRSFQEELRAQTKHAEGKLEDLKAQVQQFRAESDDAGTPASRGEIHAKRLRDLQRQMEDEQQRAKARLARLSADALTRVYRQVEEAANRIAKTQGLELVMFYTDAVNEADFYNPTALQRKLTQPGALMPLIVAPGMDITEAVVQALNRTATTPGSGRR